MRFLKTDIIEREIEALKILGCEIRDAASNTCQLARARLFRKALIKHELSINEIYGKPPKSNLLSICKGLNLEC